MANLILSRLIGTLQTVFKVGSHRLSSATQLEVQDSAGSLAPIKASGLVIPTSAVNGYVWTSDGAGVGSWQASTGGGGGGGGGLTNNFSATSDPSVNDDSGDTYSIGSRWINITTDKEFVCTDNTLGAAVWVETTASIDFPDDQYGARIWRSTNLALSANVDQVITYDTQVYDYGGYYDPAFPTRFTVPSGKAGIHILTFNASFAANANLYRILRFKLNGSTTYIASTLTMASPTYETMHNITTSIYLNDGDYVESVMQSPYSLNCLTSANNAPIFTISRVGGVSEEETAIHTNQGNEISTIPEKTTPANDDWLVIEDSAATFEKKKLKIGNLPNVSSDTAAIHDNVTGEISALTEKTTPVSGDWLLIEDSAASDGKKKIQIGNLPNSTGANAIHDDIAGEISAITEKGTPASGDWLLIEDSADSNNKKKVQAGNLSIATTGGLPAAIRIYAHANFK